MPERNFDVTNTQHGEKMKFSIFFFAFFCIEM